MNKNYGAKIGLILLALSTVVNFFFTVSWSASKVDVHGRVYFINHGEKLYLPLPPLAESHGLFGLLLLLLLIQVISLLIFGIKGNRSQAGKGAS